MERQHAVHGLELAGLDQAGMGDRDRMQRPFQLPLPEIQELQQHRKFRSEVVFLPDIALQKARMIGHAIEDRRSRQSVTLELTDELLRNHEASFVEPTEA